MERKATYIFAAYEIDYAYGGSEEGGWWYSTGELRRVLGSARMTEEAAMWRCIRLNRLLNHMQADKREVSSMAYDGGRYQVFAYDAAQELPPQYWPAQRPHYE